MKIIRLVVILYLPLIAAVFAAEPRYLLTKNYQKDQLREHLVPATEYHPFPTASERKAWSAILPSLRTEYIKRGEQALTDDWPALPASLYLDFKRTGIRTNYSAPYQHRRQKLRDLVLAECIEGKGRFLEQIMNGIWAICEESSWCPPYHISAQKAGIGLPDVSEPIVDLFAAETANLMAWTYYLLGGQLDEISPLIKDRILLETRKRIIMPLHQRLDFWWMWTPGGVGGGHHINNWTPWICSNWLTAVLLLEQDEIQRIDDVYKCLETLDRFLNFYHEDGGCDEGPSYFNRAGGAAFDCLELLFDATSGCIDLYDEPLVKNMATYIYKAHIANRYYTNFADAPAVLDVHPFHLFRFGERIGDDVLMAFAAEKAQEQDILNKGIQDNLGRQLYFLFNAHKISRQPAAVPLLQDVWLPGIQVMAARERGGSTRGLYVAAKGGYNDESHNHNDVGHFIVYQNGQPAIIDVGVETYRAQTFSDRRYEIWTMQSAYHNVPTINNVMQAHGKSYRAQNVHYTADADHSQLSMDITAAYPEGANVKSWKRQFLLDRKSKTIRITDSYELSRITGKLYFTLMTPCKVKIQQDHLLLTGGLSKENSVNLNIKFDKKLHPQVETIHIDDARLRKIWGENIYRILLTNESPGSRGSYMITMMP